MNMIPPLEFLKMRIKKTEKQLGVHEKVRSMSHLPTWEATYSMIRRRLNQMKKELEGMESENDDMG